MNPTAALTAMPEMGASFALQFASALGPAERKICRSCISFQIPLSMGCHVQRGYQALQIGLPIDQEISQGRSRAENILLVQR